MNDGDQIQDSEGVCVCVAHVGMHLTAVSPGATGHRGAVCVHAARYPEKHCPGE